MLGSTNQFKHICSTSTIALTACGIEKSSKLFVAQGGNDPENGMHCKVEQTTISSFAHTSLTGHIFSISACADFELYYNSLQNPY